MNQNPELPALRELNKTHVYSNIHVMTHRVRLGAPLQRANSKYILLLTYDRRPLLKNKSYTVFFASVALSQ